MTLVTIFGIIAIVLVVVGVILFSIGVAFPKLFKNLQEDDANIQIDWPWVKRHLNRLIRLVLEPTTSPQVRIVAGGLLLISLGLVFFIVAGVTGVLQIIASSSGGGGSGPTPTPTPTAS